MRLKKPVTIDGLITTEKFAKMMKISMSKLYYRLKNDQVKPAPKMFGMGRSLVFSKKAKIVIPKRRPGGGRPKGSKKVNTSNGPL